MRPKATPREATPGHRHTSASHSLLLLFRTVESIREGMLGGGLVGDEAEGEHRSNAESEAAPPRRG
jgi:hypothetical protein